MTQAVTWAACQGIAQFIDLGARLPASPPVHQAARAVLPAARVAYVDIDPVVPSAGGLRRPAVGSVAANISPSVIDSAGLAGAEFARIADSARFR